MMQACIGEPNTWAFGVVALFLILGATAGLRDATAAERTLLPPSAATDIEAWTVQPPVNALGPIPANGSWRIEGSEIVAAGSSAPWTVMTTGSPDWTDFRLSVKVTVRKPSPRSDFPVFHAEFDRYLSRADFPPLCQHTGQYRYRYFAGEFDWGSDAAVLVRHKDRQDCYRVQLSTEYQEMILWHGTGGYLQVVPCALEAGRTYQLEVEARGAHLRVLLDGEEKIAYWHTCLPTLSGGIGLAAYNSTVAFGEVRVTSLDGPAPAASAHEPRFALRQWRGLSWVFDGNEPILLMEKDGNVLAPDYSTGVMIFHFVKLRPGYRPLYFGFVGARKNESKTTAVVGDAARVTGDGTGQLTIQFDGATSDNSMLAHHKDVLTLDRVRGTYRHDMTTDVEFAVAQTITHLEFADPLTYNNKEPGRSVRYRWLPAGHQWGVFRSEGGEIHRHPISQSLDLEEQNRWVTARGSSFWMLYPDRAVCPVWEHHTAGEQTNIGVCHWGYDWHQYVHIPEPRQYKAGDHLVIRYALVGYRPEEGEKLFLESVLCPRTDQPEVAAKPRNFLRIPSAFGYAVCEPAGTSFDQLYNVREPYIGWQFYGDYAMDRHVGRTDHYSLRLDGPAHAKGLIYHHMIDGHAKRYLCSVWLKTKGVGGSGPVVKLYYPWGADRACDTVRTGWTGDCDWQEVSFVTEVPAVTPTTYDSSEFLVSVDGPGIVWVDDFSLRPLEEGETVVEHRPSEPPAAPATSADYLMHLRCDEGAGLATYDASHHGNSAKLHGVQWVETDGRAVLHFDGTASAFVPYPSPELTPTQEGLYPQPALTLEAWVRPAAGAPGGSLIGYLNSPQLSLSALGDDRFALAFSVVSKGQGERLTSSVSILAGRWTHVAATFDADGKACLYVNGEADATKRLPGRITYGAYVPMISIGTYGKLYGAPYFGDIAEIRWWSRAATASEIAAAAAMGLR